MTGAATSEASPRQLAPATMAAGGIWALADRRAGTAAQSLGIAERLGGPFRPVSVHWGNSAGIPWPWPTLGGLTSDARQAIAPPWPSLVISAGRRSAPVARWLGRRGAHLVHCMRPGFAAAAFDLLVIGRHDAPETAPNIFPILGACHRLSPHGLALARDDWPAFGALPSPRIALVIGGPVRAIGMNAGVAARIARQVAGFAGSILATTSRRTGPAAAAAVAEALAGHAAVLHRWDEGGRNPYAAMLAWADAVVVTGDSTSMVSEALATTVPVFIADPGNLGDRHKRLAETLFAARQARPLDAAPAPFERAPLDESARVVAEIRARGWA